MPEPITIISALATIIGVTITTSIQLTNLFSSIRDAPKEILGLYLELQSIQSVILDIQRSFESGGVSDSVPSEWIKDLDLTLRGCADVLAELTTLISKLKSSMQTGWYKRTWKGVKWTFLERDVKVLTTRLESFKSTLGLKMQALSTMINVRVEGRVDQLHDGVGEIRDMLDRLVSSEPTVEDSGRIFLENNINGAPGYAPTSPALSSDFCSASSLQNSPPTYWSLFSTLWKSGASKNMANQYSFEDSSSSYTQLQQKTMIDTHQTLYPRPVMPSQQSRKQGDTHTRRLSEAFLPRLGTNNDEDYLVSVGIRFGSNSSSAVYLVSCLKENVASDAIDERPSLSDRLVSKIPMVLSYNHGGQLAGWVHDTANSLDSDGVPRSGMQRVSTLYSNATSWKPWTTPATLPRGKQQTDLAVEYLLKLREAIYLDLYRDFGYGFRPSMTYHLVAPIAFNDTEKETIKSAMTQLGFLEDTKNLRLTMVTEPEAAITNLLNARSMGLEIHHTVLTISFGGDRVDLIAYLVTEGIIVPCTYRSGDTSGSKSPRNRFTTLVQDKIAAMRIHEESAERVFSKCMLHFENEINENFSNCGRSWRVNLSTEGRFFRAGVIDQDGFMTFTNAEILQCFDPLCKRTMDLARAQITSIEHQELKLEGILFMGELAKLGYLEKTVESNLKKEYPHCFFSTVDSCAAIADGAARAGLMSEVRRPHYKVTTQQAKLLSDANELIDAPIAYRIPGTTSC